VIEGINSKDPDIRASYKAMLRAAQRAWELSVATGTPFYVMRDGKVVDLNAPRTKKSSPRRRVKKPK
jgi:hypothetical protein